MKPTAFLPDGSSPPVEGQSRSERRGRLRVPLRTSWAGVVICCPWCLRPLSYTLDFLGVPLIGRHVADHQTTRPPWEPVTRGGLRGNLSPGGPQLRTSGLLDKQPRNEFKEASVKAQRRVQESRDLRVGDALGILRLLKGTWWEWEGGCK